MIDLKLGDCIEKLKEIKNETIDCTITSPPYDNLRSYNNTNDWNFDKFKILAKELYRITKNGGVVVWVVGDATINGSETGTSFKQALFFKDIGFNLYDTMIYKKESQPLSHRRYEQKFEYMFVFSKGRPKTFNPILEPKKYMDKRIIKGFGRNKDDSRDNGFSSKKTTKIKGNIWEYAVGGNKSSQDKEAFKHPAIFPEQLATDHITSWTNENDTVLDPLMGSGTVGKMCVITNRNFIGIEKVEEYFEIAKKRIDKYNKTLKD